MNYHLNLAYEQQQRVENDYAAIEYRQSIVDELYSKGKFDGLMAHEPKEPNCQIYWRGYSEGYQAHWIAKLRKITEKEPF